MEEKPSLKDRRFEKTRAKILDAAEEIIEEAGLDGLTMDQIAGRALYSKAALYTYFESKDELLNHLGIRAYRQMTKMFQGQVNDSLAGIEQVKNMGWAYYDFTQQYHVYWEIIKIADLNAVPHDVLEDFITTWVGAIKRAMNDGTLNKVYSPEVMAHVFASVASGAIEEYSHRKVLWDQLGMTSRKVMEIVFDLILKGAMP